MRMLRETHSYATSLRAADAFNAECKALGLDPDSLRWFVIAQPNARYSPVVMLDKPEYMAFAFRGKVAVIK